MSDQVMCLVQLDGMGAIDGWLIATDSHDMRRKLHVRGDTELEGYFYRREFWPAGKHQIGPNHVLLVGEG